MPESDASTEGAKGTEPDKSLTNSEDGIGAGTVEQVISRWQGELLQLDRRNNLLYFKGNRRREDTKSKRRAIVRCVPIVGQSPDELDEFLQTARKGRSFDYAERRRKRPTVEDPGTEEGTGDEDIHLVEGELKTDVEPLALQRVLLNSFRRDREWEEEQGINVLFLAIGFLDWVDQDGEPVRSPLLLLPCNLKRASPREAFRLHREDDDATSNATLRHKLQEFNVELPDFGDEAPSAYLEMVGRVVRKKGWSVSDDTVLSTFNYTKLAMWEDLERMKTEGVSHPLVRQLAGDFPKGASVATDGASMFPADSELAGGRLDDILDLRQQFTVVDADHSQLRAVAAARNGENLVLHGPPGTGKSQTITNIIAGLLADGKRVLFVSEKSVALDVVKKRLEEAGLGVFCLDLHSDRAKKSSVYEQLRASVDDKRLVHRLDFSYADLETRRDYLNEAVRALHQTRPPLGRSVFAIQGEFARLRALPEVEFKVPDPGEMAPETLSRITSIAQRIQRRPEDFREHDTSRWLPLAVDRASIGLPDNLRRDMEKVRGAIHTVVAGLAHEAEAIGAPAPTDLEEAATLQRLANHLPSSPAVLPLWLARDALASLQRIAADEADQQTLANKLERRVLDALGERLPEVNFARLSTAARPAAPDREAFERVFGADWATRFMPRPAEPRNLAEGVLSRASQYTTAVAEIAEQLDQPEPPDAWSESGDMVDLVGRAIWTEDVPQTWTEFADLSQMRREFAKAAAANKELDEAEAALFEYFEDAILDVVDRDLLVRYRTDHQSALRIFKGGYRRDARLLRGYLKTPGKLSADQGLTAVQGAMRVKELRAEWTPPYADLKPALGLFADDRDTDWDAVLKTLKGLAELVQDWSLGEPRLTAILTDLELRRGLRSSHDRAEESLAELMAALERLDSEQLGLDGSGMAAFAARLREALHPLRKLCEVTREVVDGLSKPPPDWTEFCGLIDDVVRLRQLEAAERDSRSSLAHDFGGLFNERATDWQVVQRALAWTGTLLDLSPAGISERLRELVCMADPPPGLDAADARLEDLRSAYLDSLRVLEERFEATRTGWGAWSAAPFAELDGWAESVSDDADSASGWVEYSRAVHELDAALGNGTVTGIREQTESSAQVPDIVLRRLYAAWLDFTFAAEPVLANFTGRDHGDERQRFGRLDRALPQVMREEVREVLYAKYPASRTSVTGSGQVGILRGELAKRRRQMPVRKLLQRIPKVIQALKPCLLMSPLAVSQYLARGDVAGEHVEFDAVVFDEASQVLPEDAVPAIARAKQTIVVGDQQQLPPTTVFTHRSDRDDDVDDDDDDEVDWLIGRESILDVLVGMVGQNIGEHYLGVHYRSRHESLIRYSNHYFYKDRLLTFPSPGGDDRLGIMDEYLPNALYDAGGSRTNRGEAERVVELVFDLMRTTPANESVGVVALSRIQADLIETLIEEERIYHPELDARFSSALDERFFVKNLENVQGDERDHILLSIGYGPSTGSGRTYNRFGPINNDGGHRRLNVAVSRAKRSMTVVHSLNPQDITATNEGARLLRRYLEYVQSPDTALEQNLTVDAEAETANPFEEAVRRALLERGYRVDVQVGVAGYRIDLAILAEDGRGHILGIETDGATYHSAPAARDRDWLRQQVLEGLGWNIHRIWSRSWIQDPERELRAVDQAVAAATTARQEPNADEIDGDQVNGQDAALPVVEVLESDVVASALDDEEDLHFDSYQFADISENVVGEKLSDELIERIRALTVAIVEIEGPVHTGLVIERIRLLYGLGRVRGSTRDHVSRGITSAVRAKEVEWLPEKIKGREQGQVFLRMRDDTTPIRPRVSADEKYRRSIEHIPLEEIKAGVMICARLMYGAARDDLVAETTRRFGFKRTGAGIRARVGEAVDQLVREGALAGNARMLSTGD